MTRVTAGMRRCPSCGRDLQNAGAYANSSPDVDLDAPALAPGAPGAEGKPAATAAGPVSFTVEPAEVRALVASSPEWIEPGLRVHGDGVNFQTPVGAIDLLAQDDAGGLVVVMVVGAPDKEIVLELLQRVGFVRTRVAKSGQEVRGLLLVERLSEPARYALAAVGDTLSVKSWRVVLSFEPLAL